MKRVLFFIILFIYSCGNYQEYVEQREYDPVDRIHLIWQDWIDNPDHFIEFIRSLAPIQVCDSTKISSYINDPVIPDEAIEDCESIFTTIYRFGEEIYYVVVYGNKKQKEFFFYSMLDNLFVSFSITGPLLVFAPQLSSKTISTTEGYYILQTVKFSKYVAKISILNKNIFLLKGNNNWGLRHIRRHYPSFYKNIQLPPGKHLFLESSDSYVIDLLKRFQQANNIKFLPHKSNKLTKSYEATIVNKYGIKRTYRLVVSSDGRIITFYPTTRLPKRIAINFENYYNVVYK